jgi:hypothetical protein
MILQRRATVYVGAHERVPSPGVCEAGSREAPKPRLLDRMREALRLRRYSRRTEEAYIPGPGGTSCSTVSVTPRHWALPRSLAF